MSGFDSATLQQSVFAQTLQFGAILRGSGPPVPQMGVTGSLYVDLQTWQLFEKRATDSVDPWGHYLFVVPSEFRTGLKWFSTSAPADTVGAPGDYCLLWGGFANYGMQPSVFGPKQAKTWPEDGSGPVLLINPFSGSTVLPVGLLDESSVVFNESNSTQLVATGLNGEAILPMPVLAGAGQSVNRIGLRSSARQISVTINPLFTAVDQNADNVDNFIDQFFQSLPTTPPATPGVVWNNGGSIQIS